MADFSLTTKGGQPSPIFLLTLPWVHCWLLLLRIHSQVGGPSSPSSSEVRQITAGTGFFTTDP